MTGEVSRDAKPSTRTTSTLESSHELPNRPGVLGGDINCIRSDS